jgi:predicted ATPase
MGLHTGEPLLTDEGYVGLDVHRTARICSAAHGGQVVLSEATARLIDADIRDLGEYRLKDLAEPQRLYQLGHEDFPALRTEHFSNLPVQPTALVGREREREDAGALLREHRLVTLVGPGGTGKTRLALEVAAEAADEFEDGVFWVPLATIRDPDLFEPTVAAALGIKESLATHLAHRQVLLLLDNFEQLADAAPRLAELLGSTARLKFLVTSREPLHLTGEWEFAVPSLPQTDAVDLFTERARAVKADFEPDDAVAAICRRLDGLPLAIELAAARVRVLTAAQMLERLSRSFDLLTGGARDLPSRQQTMRATVDWSYELLVPEERALFMRLGVFSGGWTLDAAEVVCEVSLDTLQSLVAKSLVQQSGERFATLEMIREYALERLETSSGYEDLRNRHAAFFLALAEQAAPELDRSDAQTWTARLNAEHGNLRAALEHFERSGAIDPQLRLCAAIWNLWFFEGLWQESRRAVERALASSSGATPARIEVMLGAGFIAVRQGDDQAGKEFADESLRLSRELDDSRLIGRSLRLLAYVAEHEEDWGRASALLEESAVFAKSAGDLVGLAGVIEILAAVAMNSQARDYSRAAEGFAEALSIARQAGNTRASSVFLLELAYAERYLGEYQKVRAHLAEAVAIARKLGYREVVVSALYTLAAVAASVGDDGWAGALVGAGQREGDFGFTFEATDRASYDFTMSSIRQNLGADGTDRAIAAGRAMTLDSALQYLETASGIEVPEPGDRQIGAAPRAGRLLPPPVDPT